MEDGNLFNSDVRGSSRFLKGLHIVKHWFKYNMKNTHTRPRRLHKQQRQLKKDDDDTERQDSGAG